MPAYEDIDNAREKICKQVYEYFVTYLFWRAISSNESVCFKGLFQLLCFINPAPIGIGLITNAGCVLCSIFREIETYHDDVFRCQVNR
jgi:hypothetical protein